MKGLATNADGIPVLTDYDTKQTVITDQGLTVSLLRESQLYCQRMEKQAGTASIKSLHPKETQDTSKSQVAPLRPLAPKS